MALGKIMSSLYGVKKYLGMLAGVSTLIGCVHAQEPNNNVKAALQPVRMNNAYIRGEGLEPLTPWPVKMQIRPIKSHRLVTWFAGEKLVVMVYEADDGLLQFTDLPYDEHVNLLNGTATLISQDGERHEFKAGDHFVVPKGWTGTWELKDNYRELITFEAESLDYAMKLWALE